MNFRIEFSIQSKSIQSNKFFKEFLYTSFIMYRVFKISKNSSNRILMR